MTRGPLADIVEMIDATKHVWLVVVVKLFTKANSDGQRYTSAIRFFANADIAFSETQKHPLPDDPDLRRQTGPADFKHHGKREEHEFSSDSDLGWSEQPVVLLSDRDEAPLKNDEVTVVKIGDVERYVSMSRRTLPCTSVKRKSRPP